MFDVQIREEEMLLRTHHYISTSAVRILDAPCVVLMSID